MSSRRRGASTWTMIRFAVLMWLLRTTGRLLVWLLVMAVAVAAWALTIVAGLGYLAAYLAAWLAAWLAAGPAVPRRPLVPDHHRRLPARRRPPGPHLAGDRAGPVA